MHGGHDLIFYKQIPYPPLSAQIKSSLFTLHRIRYLTSIFSIWMKWFASLHHCDLWQSQPPPSIHCTHFKPSLDSKEKKETTRSVQRHGWACHKSDDDQDQIGPPQPFVDLYHFNQKKIRKNLAWPGSKGTPIPQFTIIWDLSIYLTYPTLPTYVFVH